MSSGYAAALSEGPDKGKCGVPEVEDSADVVDAKIIELASMIAAAKKIVLHTGAGISTAAGIPDFRGPSGIWTLEERGEAPPTDTVSFGSAEPTATHRAISALVERGVVAFVVSQNVDGLHLRSGIPRRRLAELHGNIFMEKCGHCRYCFTRVFPQSFCVSIRRPGCCGAQRRLSICPLIPPALGQDRILPRRRSSGGRAQAHRPQVHRAGPHRPWLQRGAVRLHAGLG